VWGVSAFPDPAAASTFPGTPRHRRQRACLARRPPRATRASGTAGQPLLPTPGYSYEAVYRIAEAESGLRGRDGRGRGCLTSPACCGGQGGLPGHRPRSGPGAGLGRRWRREPSAVGGALAAGGRTGSSDIRRPSDGSGTTHEHQ